MYQWIPKKTNKTAEKVILILLGGAILMFGVTVVFPTIAYRWAYQLIALGMLTLILYLVTRYVTRSYLYRIGENGEGGTDMEIIEKTGNGKRQVTVCRISLTGLVSLVLLDLSDGGKSETLLATRKREKKKIYDYCVNLQPEKSCLLRCFESGEELWIRLEYEPGLWDLLSSHLPEEEENASRDPS